MNDLLLHPATSYQLEALVRSTPQAVLITGATGIGKQVVAEKFIATLLDRTISSNDPYAIVLQNTEGSIGIEDIRKLREFLRRKTTGKALLRRAVCIYDAHTMTTEAQNALLKTLEEPPADTVIVLTASDITALKPTIRSRSQQLHVLPIGQEAALKYFKQYSPAEVKSAYYMSDGRPGLLKALLEDKAEHELVNAISRAKELLAKSAYDRLVLVDSLSKQKPEVQQLLQGLERLVVSGLRQSASKSNLTATKKFYHLSQLVRETQTLLDQSVNTKLTLTRLLLQM